MKTSQQGFTLLELMMAIAIFAVLSAMAYGGLNSVLKTSQHTREVSEKLQQLQVAMAIIQQDFTQIANRPARNEFGESDPPLSGQEGADPLVNFTRSGWRNPLLQVRSTLQRVAYRLDEDKLVRLYWPQLDRAPNTEPVAVTLLEGVEEFRLEYIESGDNRSTNWPTLTNTEAPAPLPRAIRMTLVTQQWGNIERLFRLTTP